MTSHPRWDKETIFHRGREFYAAVLEDVRAAQHSIDVEVYIFADDDLGRRVVEALKDAARRKVAVRVVADGFGAQDWAAAFLPELLEAGVEARVYRPLPWMFLKAGTQRVPRLHRLVRLLGAVNRRNHRKVWILDGRVAYVGSLNVTADHLDGLAGGANWRDTGVRVEGAPVQELSWGFGKAWAESWRFTWQKRRVRGRLAAPPPGPLSGLVRLNDRLRSRRWLFQDLRDRVAAAQQRVWITNPYFVPARRLVRDLCRAARRGVDVRILVPRHPDVGFIRWVTAAFFAPLLQAGVRVFEYLPSVLHAKVLQVDGWATVGSSNLNHRSLIHDLEVDLVITHAQSRETLERQFLEDLQHAEEVTPASLKKLSTWGVLAGRLLLLFRYWM